MDEYTEIATIPPKCHPWSNVLSCPLLIFVILMSISIIFSIASIYSHRDRQSVGTTWTVIIISTVLNILFAFLFGLWIYHLCKRCDHGVAWIVFIIVLFFPLILFLLTFFILLFFIF